MCESIMIANLPEQDAYSGEVIEKFEFAKQVIVSIRNFRQEKGISNKNTIELFVKKNNDEEADTTFDSVVIKLCNISKLSYVTEKVNNAFSVNVKATELFIPLNQSDDIDIEGEIAKLEKDLKYQEGFLASIEKKLSNERFMKNAPQNVIDKELKKKSDSLSVIEVIKKQLSSLKEQ